MGQPTIFEEYFLYPLARAKDAVVWWIITNEFKRWGMDLGKYPIEKMLRLYSKHNGEIDRT